MRLAPAPGRGSARVAAAVAAAAVLLVLPACGDESSTDGDGGADDTSSTSTSESSSESADPATADWPACDEVWVDGAEIPGRYKGCLGDEGPVKADKFLCSSGQVLVTYGEHFYGVTGGPVNEVEGGLADDKTYAGAKQSCLA